LKKIREAKGFSLREAAKRSGLSHSYINSLEKGEHPNTKAPINPTPDILKRLAAAYNCDYIELMEAAGYVVEDEKDRLEQESEVERVIREAEEHYGVSLRDDPHVNRMLRELIYSIAEMKQK
jgi:transcriptional regulator with XRE-family HTH domain